MKDQWAASMTLRTIFLSLQALLCSPEPEDPQDAVVAKQFKGQRDIFTATARHWAQVYAGGSVHRSSLKNLVIDMLMTTLIIAPGPVSEEFRSKISALKDMGVSEVSQKSSVVLLLVLFKIWLIGKRPNSS